MLAGQPKQDHQPADAGSQQICVGKHLFLDTSGKLYNARCGLSCVFTYFNIVMTDKHNHLHVLSVNVMQSNSHIQKNEDVSVSVPGLFCKNIQATQHC